MARESGPSTSGPTTNVYSFAKNNNYLCPFITTNYLRFTTIISTSPQQGQLKSISFTNITIYHHQIANYLLLSLPIFAHHFSFSLAKNNHYRSFINSNITLTLPKSYFSSFQNQLLTCFIFFVQIKTIWLFFHPSNLSLTFIFYKDMGALPP